MLSDRRQRVLAALIEEYVARAMPVGSRTLTERYELGVSPATIRNELSVLEDEGYISQPHTSAGRVPTDYGYRTFVDRLVESGAISDDPETLEKLRNLRAAASELDDLIEQTSAAITQFTDCLTIVAPPDMPHPRRTGMSSLMKQPEFAYTQSLLPIMQVLEDESVLLEILDSTAQDSGSPNVKIGRENEAEQFSGVSVVASRYGMGSGEGIIAVIGPTRMDYSRVLQAVKIACRTLTNE
ncbi:MAG: hypothetical protein J5818_04155 [Eggerthellaceae bacterium]|nr:hypothetical protein [Eggerthellaceae bacterium]